MDFDAAVARTRTRPIASGAVDRIGLWFRGQLLVSASLALLTFALLTILSIPNALLLSLIAGIAAFVPLIGALLGILPAVVVALTISTAKAIIVLIVGFALYHIVANVLVSKLMSRVVGLNPVAIVLVMLVGAELAGAMGLIVAIPIAIIIDAVVRELSQSKTEVSRDA